MGILVVEDDEAIRDFLGDLLRDEGYLVATAGHGRAALAHLERGPWLPTLILLDLMMPVMDGLQLARALAAHPVFAHIPIVVMTAGGKLGEELRDVPVVDILPKPIQAERLLRMVARYGGAPGAGHTQGAQGQPA